MTTLPDFEADAREAILDNVKGELSGRQNNLVFRFIQSVHNSLQSYSARNDYDVESTIESLATPEVDRGRNTITITIRWESAQMARWEFGVQPHEIRARNAEVLSFVWEDPPQWVREEFEQARDPSGRFASGWRVFFESVQWGSDTGGIPASRAIRDNLNALRQLL